MTQSLLIQKSSLHLLRLLAFFLLWLGLVSPIAGNELPDTGFFLVASEEMPDPRFKESVILVTRHHLGETVGVAVNKPSEIEIATILPQNGLMDKHAKLLYFGGPLARQSLLFLIRSKEQPQPSLRIFDNVFLSADRQVLAEVLRHPKPYSGIRVFLGYAGWKKGQLESEIRQGTWHLQQADTDIIFHSDPKAIWRKLIDRLKEGRWVQLPPTLQTNG
ncbi:MAG: hypothetical protein GY703_04845 [Gammaproteobacteria bacterium]|nr:hypothetical protein [Gammaproteobacteria bacterium]